MEGRRKSDGRLGEDERMIETGLTAETIRGRLRRNWSIEKAMTTPPIEHSVMLEFKGETHNLTWNILLGGSETNNAVWQRIKRYGWSIERALSTPIKRTNTEETKEKPKKIQISKPKKIKSCSLKKERIRSTRSAIASTRKKQNAEYPSVITKGGHKQLLLFELS